MSWLARDPTGSIGTDSVSSDPKKNADKIQKAAEKMFKKKFPPGSASLP